LMPLPLYDEPCPPFALLRVAARCCALLRVAARCCALLRSWARQRMATNSGSSMKGGRGEEFGPRTALWALSAALRNGERTKDGLLEAGIEAGCCCAQYGRGLCLLRPGMR
jgi:hypothetical protein